MILFRIFLKELVDSLKALSTFFGENSLRARRNLRGDVERRSLEISENFEANFREVNQVKLFVPPTTFERLGYIRVSESFAKNSA